MNLKVFCLVVLLVGQSLLSTSVAQDWPALRGVDGSGASNPGGILSSDTQVDLKIRWKKSIGSGYSSVVVADGRVLVMFSGESKDYISCLDAQNGEKIWSVPIGPKYIGQNGSFDGPISTPLIRRDIVICLSADGKLFCLKMKDGAQIWTRDLVEQDSAPKPLYGFSTSPILFQDTLIVQTGAKDKSLAAFDVNTGAPMWAVDSGRVSSQSPTLTMLDGQPIVLAARGKHLVGVDPNDGRQLFQYEHAGGNGSAMIPVVIAPGKVLMTLDDSFSTAVVMKPSGDSVSVSQEWKQRSIKNTYNIPVVHNDHVYAYSTRILTSVSSETGRARWKNRKPGDGFLIIVDGHLIINTKKGGLHIARATPDKYAEVAATKVFDQLVWSLPAYSDNSVFMRSLGEIARVDIVSKSGRSGSATDIAAVKTSRQISNLRSKIDGAKTAESKDKILSQFLDACESFPVIEDGLATFVYRGAGSDVAVASDVFGARQERKMNRIDGTDFFHYSIPLANDQRTNYVFLVDYKPQTDPRNNRKVTSTMYAGEMEFAVRLRNDPRLEMSWFGMSQWNEPAFLKQKDELSGAVVQKTIEIERQSRRRSSDDDEEQAEPKTTKVKIDVYIPPGYDDASDVRYPVVYVFDDGSARTTGKMVQAVDTLFSTPIDQGGARPAIVVFLQSQSPTYGRTVVNKIVPMIDEEFLTIANRSGRSCLGNGFVAGTAIGLVTENVELFSGIATQSPMLFAQERQMAISRLSKVEQPTLVHIQWGRFDMHNPDENWDLRVMAQEVVDSVGQNKSLNIVGGMVNDSADWASWRNRYDDVFRALTKEAE